MVAPILDRLRQHQQAEANRDVPLPARGPLAALSALGLLLEGTQNTATAATGGGLALNAKLNPFMRLGINDNAGAMSGTRLAREAAQGFGQSRGSALQRMMAANEFAARGDERATGLLNAALDPSNLTMLGGPLAALGGRAGKLGQLLRIADEAQGLLLNRAGGAALKRLGVATDRGLRPEVSRMLADRAVGAGLGGATATVNAQFAKQAIPGEDNEIDLKTAALLGGLGGGAIGRRNLGRGLQEALGQAPGGFVARRLAQQSATGGEGSLVGMGMSPRQIAAMRRRRGSAVPQALPELADLVGEESAQELLAMFSGGKSPLSREMLSRTITAGRGNAAADNFADLINRHWDRARAGQFSAHDIISAYVPAILSQRRGALSPDTHLFNPARLEQLGTKYPDLVEKIRGNATVGGTDAGLHRPEDLAAYMMLHTEEGRDLGSALRYGDPQAVQTAIDNFSAIWPDAGFMPGPKGDIRGGERGALVQAAQDDVFGSMAAMINRMASEGRTGDEIAQVMRDWTAGAASGTKPLLQGTRDLVRGDVDSRLPSRHNWGAVIDRIANGKSGFLTTNLGGPSATFDVRVEDAMRPGSTIEDYQRALSLMFPGDDPGLAHHKFWDAMSYDPRTDTTGQTPHGGIAELIGAVGEGYRYPNPLNAGISPGGIAQSVGGLRDRLQRRAATSNLDTFMADAHPLLKNADGTPKRFYHGSLVGDFDQFETPEKAGDFGRGAYFSENPRYAGMYASGSDRAFAGSDNYRPLSEPQPNIKPTYVNLRNPYIFGSDPKLDRLFSNYERQTATEQLQALGYDGVIVQGGLFTGTPGNPNQIEELVAFDPATQVKSATGNRGTYDPSDPSLLRAGMSVDDVTDALDQIRQRFAPAVSRVAGKFPQLASDRPQLSDAEREYIGELMAFLDSDERALDDMSRLQNHAYQHWNQTLGKKADRAAFIRLWETLTAQIDSMKVLETGLGNAANVNRIINSGQGVINGFELVDQEGTGGVPGLIQRKAGAIATPGRARMLIREMLSEQGVTDEFITQAYNEHTERLRAQGMKIDKGFKLSTPQQVEAMAVKLGVPAEFLQAQFDELATERGVRFLDNEGRAKEMLGLGNPWKYASEGVGRKPNRYVYASVTEGEPAGQKQSGTIRIIWKPDTPRVTSLTHDYMLAAPDVEDLHSTATPKSVQALWGERSIPPDRPARMPIGDTGETFTGSPLAVGTRAETAARAAMVIMSSPKDLLREAQEGNMDAALGLMLRGGQDQQSAGTMKMLGIQRAPTRTETLVLDPDLRNAQAIVIHGGSEGVIQENLAVASRLLDQFGLDIPIHVMRGPTGSPPNILPEAISPGRGEFVRRYAGQRPQFAGKAEDRLSGLQDFGAGLSPGAIGRMARGVSNQALAGGAMGAAAGFAGDDEDRVRGAIKGAGVGAVGGAAFGKLAPEIGRGVAAAYRRHAPDLTDDTIMSPQALAIAHRNGVQAQTEASEAPGVALKDLPRQIDDAWRAQVVNTFRGLALDASSLWLLVKDFGRDYGVDRRRVKATLGELVAKHDDPDPIRRLGKLGDTLEGWGMEGFIDEATSLDQVLGTSFSRAEIGENKMSSPQRFLTGVGLSFTNLRDAMVPVVGPLVGGVRQVYAPYVDTAYRTLNGFQHAAPRVAFWDAALARDLPRAADRFRATIAPTGIDLGPLFSGGKPVRPSQVGQYLIKNYKGLTTAEVNQIESLYRDELATTAMESADRIAHIFGDFRDKSAKPWKTFLGRVFPFSRYAMQFAPVGLEMVKRHPVIAGGVAAGTALSAYAAAQNEEPPWFAGSVPITTETPGLGALARLRLGGQQGTVRIDPLANFTGPISGETFSAGGGLPTDTTYDKAKGLVGRIGFSPHPALDALASVTGQTNRNPGPMSRTAPIEQAAELVPGMPTVPSAQGAFNTAKSRVTGRDVDDFDPVARHYAELVMAETQRPLEDPRNRQYLINMGDVEDPLWRRARQEVRLANLVGSLVSNLTPLNQQAQGAGSAMVSQGYADRLSEEELLRLAERDPAAARAALQAQEDDPRTRTYRLANTTDRERALVRSRGPRVTPALEEALRKQRAERYRRKDR